MHSYITLVTNPDYVKGAVALAHSLQMVNSAWPLTVLTVRDLPGVDQLTDLGCRLVPVDPLPVSDDFRQRHSREAQHKAAPFTKGNKPAFHDPLDNFAKLRLWELEQFDSVVFLDADLVVVQNIDRLFAYPEFSAAPNVYETLADFHRMNSGVFTARPSKETFTRMLTHLEQPGRFWRRTDQTFLQDFFPDWHGLPVFDNMLQYVWFNLPELWSWAQVKVVHYQYEKPWQDDHPKQTQLAPLIDLWWQIYTHGRLPSPLPAPPSSITGKGGSS